MGQELNYKIIAGMIKSDQNGSIHQEKEVFYYSKKKPRISDLGIIKVTPDFEFNKKVQPLKIVDIPPRANDGPMSSCFWQTNYTHCPYDTEELQILDEIYVDHVEEESIYFGGDTEFLKIGSGVVFNNKLAAIYSNFFGFDFKCIVHASNVYYYKDFIDEKLAGNH